MLEHPLSINNEKMQVVKKYFINFRSPYDCNRSLNQT
ncbi:MAG: hypothetical protein ACI84K_001816, partial [Pseudohongiellaceae bacterium]